MDGLGLNNIWQIYSVSGDQEPRFRMVGKLLVTPTEIDVLSDNHDLLRGLQGELTPERVRRLRSLQRNPYYYVATLEDIRLGHHPHLLSEKNVPQVSGVPEREPTTTFEYLRHGLANPLLVQFREGQAHLNGQAITRLELQQLLDTVSSGQAEIRRYRQRQAAVLKMEDSFYNLAKMEPQLQTALDKLRGSVDKDTYHTIMKEIFADPMIPEMGGKKAYNHFLQNQQPGLHARIDLNSFGAINKIHSFKHGDQAIQSAAKALLDAKREADKKFAPPRQDTAAASESERELENLMQSRSYRPGGDEFHVHIPAHPQDKEHMNYFLRRFRENMDKIPAIGGTHRVSASIGLGNSAEDADQAQIHAKRAKKAMGKLPGQEDTHVHSLIQGHEGPVPHADAPPQQPEPKPEPKPAVQAPNAASVL